MTKHGETDGYSAQDFVNEIKKYLGEAKEKLTHVLVNEKTSLPKAVKGWYDEYKSQPVEDGMDARANHIKVIHDKFVGPGKLVRHDPDKIASVVAKLLVKD